MKGSGSSSPITSGIRFGATILAGFVSALVAIALIGVATYWSVKNLVRSGDRAAHNHHVIDHLEALQRPTLHSEQDPQCVQEAHFRDTLLLQNHITGPIVDGTNS